MPTWIANPKIKLHFDDPQPSKKRSKALPTPLPCFSYIFIGLSINDTRLTLGKEYYTDPLYKVDF